MTTAKRRIVPEELSNPSWRVLSFIFLLLAAFVALLLFPVPEFKGYIDPFYSPLILLLPIPAMLRLTCYTFRRGYNRHVFQHPQACEAANRNDDRSRDYTGETTPLMKIENLHRYFVYGSLLILPFFFYDLFVSLTYGGGFILRAGSILMIVETALVTLYLLSCNSIRSLIGGRNDCFSCMHAPRARKGVYDLQSFFNSHHDNLAWLSLIFVVAVDLYIRALMAGWPIDFTLFKIVGI